MTEQQLDGLHGRMLVRSSGTIELGAVARRP